MNTCHRPSRREGFKTIRRAVPALLFLIGVTAGISEALRLLQTNLEVIPSARAQEGPGEGTHASIASNCSHVRTIISWNLEGLNQRSGERGKFQAMARLAQDSDVLALQEVGAQDALQHFDVFQQSHELPPFQWMLNAVRRHGGNRPSKKPALLWQISEDVEIRMIPGVTGNAELFPASLRPPLLVHCRMRDVDFILAIVHCKAGNDEGDEERDIPSDESVRRSEAEQLRAVMRSLTQQSRSEHSIAVPYVDQNFLIIGDFNPSEDDRENPDVLETTLGRVFAEMGVVQRPQESSLVSGNGVVDLVIADVRLNALIVHAAERTGNRPVRVHWPEQMGDIGSRRGSRLSDHFPIATDLMVSGEVDGQVIEPDGNHEATRPLNESTVLREAILLGSR